MGRKKQTPIQLKKTRSQPVSPALIPIKNRYNKKDDDDDDNQTKKPILSTSSSNTVKGPFNKIQPKGRKKGRGKAGKRRKMLFDEVGTNQSMPFMPSQPVDGSTPSPIT